MNYIEQVLQHIRFKPDRAAIRQELEEHIEDMLSFAPPMEDGEAESYVREQMGDPEVVGQALDKEHHVVLGWIWRVARWAMVAMVVVALPAVLLWGIHVAIALQEFCGGYMDVGNPVAIIEVDKGTWIDGTYLHMDRLEKMENGSVYVYYWSFVNPLYSPARVEIALMQSVKDEEGTALQSRTVQWSDAYFVHYVYEIYDLEQEAKRLIFDYERYGREFYIEIPLEWEVCE